MSQKYEKLKTLLKELFQLDQPDLDFGLYRVMHAKSGEISKFLDEDLLPQVKQAFSTYQSADRSSIEQELAKVVAGIEDAGLNPNESPKVKELRAKLANESVDIGKLESEVYDHLYSFFRRYYSEGDFLAKRVYKPGVYAIPYEGEEVTLHWANKDQYYIKTSEYLRDYAFRLQPDNATNPMRVHFRLIDAAEDEHGNVKVAEGKERVFILAPGGESGHDFIGEEEGPDGKELIIRFEYRPATLNDWPDDVGTDKKSPPKQKDLISAAVGRVLAVQKKGLQQWLQRLQEPHMLASGESAGYNRLEANVRRYTARNTFDYFIHKDLGGFLRRELDFYIKNEVIHLDDVESESARRVEQYLSTIKILRKVAGKVIDFISQLEAFQKRIWLKKKFVVETQYCISVRCISESFWDDILANAGQVAEWKALHSIDRLLSAEETHKPAPQLLKELPTLMLDTRHFSADFTNKLLNSFESIAANTDGIVFHGDNFQALSLMRNLYKGALECIYIDPPYNTDASAIDYKNGYKASSWMSLLNDRLDLSRDLLKDSGVLIAAIDDEQQRELSFLLSENFDHNMLGTISVRSNPSGRPTQAGYSVSHEYMLFAGRTAHAKIGRMPPSESQMARFSQTDEEGPFEWRNLRREGSNSDRIARPALYYPIYVSKGAFRIPNMEWDPSAKRWEVLEPPLEHEHVVWPVNDEGIEKTWRWEWQTVASNMKSLAVRKDRTGKDYLYLKRRPHEEGVVSVSSWFDAKYSATEHGTALLKSMFGLSPFSYPKSIHLVMDALYIGGAHAPNSTVLDYFGGSGTTAHAVINLNRADGGNRRFVLAEQNAYVDDALLPRLKKAVFAPEWKNGKPARLATEQEVDRSPKILKIVRLESYEDSLNNLDVHRPKSQQAMLDLPEAKDPDGFKEQYILRYMLDVETRGSQSLLNTRTFIDPTAYKLKVKRAGSDESRDVNVDLLETFNWLLGLTVQQIAPPGSFKAEFERNAEQRLVLKGRLKQEAAGPWWFRTVTGTLPDGRKALVIWRKLTGDAEQDNLVLDEWLRKHAYSTRDLDFDLIYVNGGNNLPNVRRDDESWKVRLIEEDFHRLMFDTEAQ
ncbi:MAG: site-specific DNA-methyltransferase [Gammaproteobacteria bacterium]